MQKVKKLRRSFRYLGWGSAFASAVWGVLFYLRFNNPTVNAFQDIPTQLAALETAAHTWESVGFALISSSVASLLLGYIHIRIGDSGQEYRLAEENSDSAENNVAEGT